MHHRSRITRLLDRGRSSALSLLTVQGPRDSGEATRQLLITKINQAISEVATQQNCQYLLAGMLRARDIASTIPLGTQPAPFALREIVLAIDRAIESAGSTFAPDFERNQLIAGLSVIRQLCATHAQIQFKRSQQNTESPTARIYSFATAVWFALYRVLLRKRQSKQ